MSTATAQTTVVQPVDPSLREAVRLALLFATVKLVLHIAANLWQAHLGWGYFRDELYYIICGRHLAWGYVDHGPIVALQSRLAETLFGDSLTGIRMFSALAGAARVFLTGILAWSLGGRRPAQGLAMICILVAPQYLGIDSFLSMNSFESMFWMPCLLALIFMLRGGSERWWLLFGISAGIGLLNKPSMAFFLVALLVALLLTPQRRLLASRWAFIGVALLILVALPNLLWQVHNHWPTLEFLHNGKVHHKNVELGPIDFLLTQIKNLHPLTLFVWGAGLIWLLRSRDYRWLGLMFCFFFVGMMLLHAKDYYLLPVYPVLFAAGGIAWESFYHRSPPVSQNRALAFPIFESALILTGLVLMPLAIPVLRPETWIVYARYTHLYQVTSSEHHATGPLPQFYADRFGWQEYADQVERIYNSLSPEEQASAVIYGEDYGLSSAINFLGRNLPPAIGGHNNYFLWGPQGKTGEVLILLGSDGEGLSDKWQSVTVVGEMNNPYAMPYERRKIYLCRGLKIPPLSKIWPKVKHYI
ncbi:glycosyltransferase family 39 protein [Edaphobacter albus]|uniref:glycosyltransferase family 39 protein n=1 Tax=Edaphobacter sp. 4G125 TaxID=2763071 RepID=UPI0016469596|nr:glycosyltransferase family 39 protein [Edaphobacter sp. 4G125]QNI35701.1 glycosyltransferase family 39 protein [Edaphobacter sp. 4G125]